MGAKWTDEQVARLRRMFEQGATDQQIADEVGKSTNAVVGERNRRGLLRKDRLGPRTTKMEKIAIDFEPDLANQIKAQAIAEGQPFKQMVAVLCRVGLFDLTESDRLEPCAGRA